MAVGRIWALALVALAFGCDGCDAGAEHAALSPPETIRRAVEPLVWGQPQKILPPIPASTGQFGTSVAVDGDTAVVGGLSAAYAYRLQAGIWVVESELPPMGATFLFGASAALSGNTIAVAGNCYLPPNNVTLVPCAHVYVRGGSSWALEQQLLVTKNRDPTISDAGLSVAVHGDTLFLGSTLHNAVFVYERVGAVWTERQIITAPDEGDAGAAAYLGTAIALGPDTAILGKPTSSNNTYFRGTAYAFVRSSGSWTLQQSLVGSGASTSTYGTGVALSGDTAIVSDWVNPSPVHIFRRTGSTWSEEQALLNYRAIGPVAVYGDILAFIGYADTSSPRDHAVRIFERQGSTWTPSQTLPSFGGSIGLSGVSMLVGEPYETVDGFQSAGDVIAFRLSEAYDAGVDSDAEAGTEDGGIDAGIVLDGGVADGHADAVPDANEGGTLDASLDTSDSSGSEDASAGAGGREAGTGGGGGRGGSVAGGGGSTEASAEGGTAAQPSAGSGGMSGRGPGSQPPSRTSTDDSGGCGCHLHDERSSRLPYCVASLLMCGALRRRRRTVGHRARASVVCDPRRRVRSGR